MAEEIRVRLSPTGQKEVVQALRQVQSEAAVAARKTQGAFAGIGKALSGLKTLLPTLGFAAITTGLVAIGRNALNAADNLGKMAQRVGTTAERLSVLDFAAATADVEATKLQGALIRLTRSLGDLNEGTAEQVEAFDKLGLSASDFAGQDTVQSFDTIAQALGRMEAGTRRTEIATSILGRSGAELLTLMDDLAKEGFDNVAERAAAAGQIITSQMAASAAAANDSLTLMGRQVRGLAVQFVAGFGPSITQVITQFTSDLATSAGGIEGFGRTAGRVFRRTLGFIRLFSTNAINAVNFIIEAIGGNIGAVGAAIGQLLQGNVGQAFATISRRVDDVKESFSKLANDSSEALASFNKLVEEPIEAEIKLKTTGGITETERADILTNVKELEKRAGTIQIAELAQIQIQRQSILRQSAEVEAQIAATRSTGTTAAALREAATAERDAITRRLEAARTAFQTEVQLAAAKQEAVTQLARKEVGDQVLQRRIIEQVTRQSDQERLKSATTYFGELIKLQNDYTKLAQQSAETIVALDKEIAQGRQKQADFERAILLEGLSDAEKVALLRTESVEKESQLRSAALTGDLEGARRLRDELQTTAAELQKLGQSSAAKQSFAEANRLFELAAAGRKLAATDAAREANKAKESVTQQLEATKAQITELQRSLVLNIKVGPSQESLTTMIASIRTELEKQPFNINVQPTLARAGGGPIALAQGGMVPGLSPTPTADNILIRGTAGEWMHSVRAVNYYGADFMRAIDSMQLPRFQDGGQIGGSSGAGVGDMSTLNLNINTRRVGPVTGSRNTIRGLVTALKELSVGTEEA